MAQQLKDVRVRPAAHHLGAGAYRCRTTWDVSWQDQRPLLARAPGRLACSPVPRPRGTSQPMLHIAARRPRERPVVEADPAHVRRAAGSVVGEDDRLQSVVLGLCSAPAPPPAVAAAPLRVLRTRQWPPGRGTTCCVSSGCLCPTSPGSRRGSSHQRVDGLVEPVADRGDKAGHGSGGEHGERLAVVTVSAPIASSATDGSRGLVPGARGADTLSASLVAGRRRAGGPVHARPGLKVPRPRPI